MTSSPLAFPLASDYFSQIWLAGWLNVEKRIVSVFLIDNGILLELFFGSDGSGSTAHFPVSPDNRGDSALQFL
jgi:hypothetical protein